MISINIYGMNKSEAGKLGYLKSRMKHKKAYQIRIEKYNLSPKLCKFCQKPLAYDLRRNDFCNHSCATSFTNLGIARNVVSGKYKRALVVCLNCSKRVMRRAEGKFCSYGCQCEFQYKEYIKRWLAGEEDGIVANGLGTSNYIRRWLKDNYEEKCSECGWNRVNPFSNKIPIQLDHIDGNSKNNCPENLRLLCPSCHSLTSTYGGLNKGKGRKARYAAIV